LKRFNVAGFPSAHTWATIVVLISIGVVRRGLGTKLHVLVASGIAWPALRGSVKTTDCREPPEILTASCLPLTSTRRSCGDPPTLTSVFGRRLKVSVTNSVLDAAAVTWLPLFVVTLQKT
jgi:hypothetical protein